LPRARGPARIVRRKHLSPVAEGTRDDARHTTSGGTAPASVRGHVEGSGSAPPQAGPLPRTASGVSPKDETTAHWPDPAADLRLHGILCPGAWFADPETAEAMAALR
jgi:hypothetical protein